MLGMAPLVCGGIGGDGGEGGNGGEGERNTLPAGQSATSPVWIAPAKPLGMYQVVSSKTCVCVVPSGDCDEALACVLYSGQLPRMHTAASGGEGDGGGGEGTGGEGDGGGGEGTGGEGDGGGGEGTGGEGDGGGGEGTGGEGDGGGGEGTGGDGDGGGGEGTYF